MMRVKGLSEKDFAFVEGMGLGVAITAISLIVYYALNLPRPPPPVQFPRLRAMQYVRPSWEGGEQ